MHTIRLLQSAVNIFKNNKIEIRIKNRDELLDIKAGNWDYDDLLLLADQLIEELNLLADRSSLPDLPDKEKAKRTLLEIRISYTNNTIRFDGVIFFTHL
jgi:hypothetical protein